MNRLMVVILATGLLAGCTDGSGNKQAMGTLVGAGLGALAGAQIGHGKGQLAATAIGALIGAGMGREVGKSLDRADRAAMAATSQQALELAPSGTTKTWSNPDSGNYGTVTPEPAARNGKGQNCREFTQTITVGGETRTGYGRACRQDDGSWKLVGN